MSSMFFVPETYVSCWEDLRFGDEKHRSYVRETWKTPFSFSFFIGRFSFLWVESLHNELYSLVILTIKISL